MPQIEVDDRTYHELELLAVAWHTTISEAVHRLVIKAAARATIRAHAAKSPVEVHAFYNGTRIDATFDAKSHAVTVCSGPLCGQTFTSPSAARRAVIAQFKTTVRSEGNGWIFWKVTANSAHLDSLRR